MNWRGPFFRCKATWSRHAIGSRRCDLRRNHHGPHLSAQGMDELWWWEVDPRTAAERYFANRMESDEYSQAYDQQRSSIRAFYY